MRSPETPQTCMCTASRSCCIHQTQCSPPQTQRHELQQVTRTEPQLKTSQTHPQTCQRQTCTQCAQQQSQSQTTSPQCRQTQIQTTETQMSQSQLTHTPPARRCGSPRRPCSSTTPPRACQRHEQASHSLPQTRKTPQQTGMTMQNHPQMILQQHSA